MPPKVPQRERIRSSFVNHVSRKCVYSSLQVSSRSLDFKGFPIFPVSSSSCHQFHQIQSGIKIRALSYVVLLNIKFDQDPITRL